MPGSFSVEPDPPDLTPAITPVHVYRYDPDAPEAEGPYTLIPNVYCVSVAEMEHAEPTSAQFTYMLDDTCGVIYDWPSQFEDLWPMQAPESQYRVKQGDRLVVLATLPDDTKRLLFDGFVTAPQADVSANAQEITFTAASAEVRCWDTPITGRWQRQGDKASSTADADVVQIGGSARFNPDGKPNCTPADKDVDDGGYVDFPHPVFIANRGDDESDKQSLWTLAKAAKYILARCNSDEKFVDNPDFSVLVDLLNNRSPKDGTDSYDPGDPATYDEHPITLSDYDAGNRPWPEALGELLNYYGFAMRFVSELDDKKLPWHHLEIERRDQEGPRAPKNIQLPKVGADVDPGTVNVASFHVAHDFRDVANAIEIETKPKLYEASFVLAPGFTPTAGDELAVNAGRFLLSTSSTETDEIHDRYRLYVLDEMGEGHWSFADAAWQAAPDPPDLKALFPEIDPGDGKPKTPGYVNRYRPGRRELVTKDAKGDPLKATLHLSRDYAGPDPPCLWDGSGTWQPIAGSWRLLDDRLGIFVTAEDPRQWKIGDDRGTATPQEHSKTLNGIACLTAPSTTINSLKKFTLLLTTVVEGDHGIEVSADKRKASPIDHTITRRVDARDHYRYAEVTVSSRLGDGNAVIVDDTAAALEKATQLRAAHEFPPISGSVTIPHLDFSLEIGDRIDKINGRDVSLQVNAGSEADEAKSYPFVVARSLSMSGDQQSTVLQLSDRRYEPPPIGRRR
jgi:hypothetical protein